jgi:transposase
LARTLWYFHAQPPGFNAFLGAVLLPHLARALTAAQRARVDQSFASTGDCYDNAAVEAFWATLKRELGWIHNTTTWPNCASPGSVEASSIGDAMTETRRRFDPEFRECAVRIVRETGKPIAQVARELGVNEGTLGNWVNRDRAKQSQAPLSDDERGRLEQLERENVERDVLKRSVVLWVKEATR